MLSWLGANCLLKKLFDFHKQMNFLFAAVYGTVKDYKNQWINGTKIKIDQQVHTLSPSMTGEFYFILTQGKHVLEFSAPGGLNFLLVIFVCLWYLQTSKPHYFNTPMQYDYKFFNRCGNDNFRVKKYFSYFCSKYI